LLELYNTVRRKILDHCWNLQVSKRILTKAMINKADDQLPTVECNWCWKDYWCCH